MKAAYPTLDPERSDEVASEVVSEHTCGCTPTVPCPRARAIFDRNGPTYPGDLWNHLNASYRVSRDRPNGVTLTTELERLRAINRARAAGGAS